VPRQFEAKCFGCLILNGFNGFVLEFHNHTALSTNDVIMVVVIDGFKARLPIIKMALFSQTRLHQKQKCPVHGRITDFCIDLPHDLEQFFNAQMLLLLLEKHINNRVALVRIFETVSRQIVRELVEAGSVIHLRDIKAGLPFGQWGKGLHEPYFAAYC